MLRPYGMIGEPERGWRAMLRPYGMIGEPERGWRAMLRSYGMIGKLGDDGGLLPQV
ncbi:hypothetical protein [Candidatus Oscillochloris fontis]|uniref:hypothetical protein n=1 Tax=Candidatus Oscillochloris fontis TaxID=2496868 RepID=UPI001375BCB8|nr:hypothetical protein [Candidatus Oscillochloris fontis]